MKEWEGMIEKEFTCVVYAYTKESDDPEKRAKHYFSLSNHGDSAKFPPAIFGEEVLTIPNDCQTIYEKIKEFVS